MISEFVQNIFMGVNDSKFFQQAKAKRRFVLGLREVSKHLKLRKLKCVIISSNVERIKSAGKRNINLIIL